MDDLWDIKRFCRWWFNLPEGAEPKKSNSNSIRKQCRDSKLPPVKICGAWHVDVASILKEVERAKKKSGAR